MSSPDAELQDDYHACSHGVKHWYSCRKCKKIERLILQVDRILKEQTDDR